MGRGGQRSQTKAGGGEVGGVQLETAEIEPIDRGERAGVTGEGHDRIAVADHWAETIDQHGIESPVECSGAGAGELAELSVERTTADLAGQGAGRRRIEAAIDREPGT